MTIKKSLMIAGALASVGVSGAAALPHFASAETDGSTKTSIVDRIADRFDLNKDEVKKVFDEDRAAHEAEHKAKMEERLDQAVADGKLTEEQKDKILAKLDELKADKPDFEELKDKSPEERREFMEQRHDELKKWAEDNDIPEEYLPMRIHMKTRGGPGGPGGHEMGMVFTKEIDD